MKSIDNFSYVISAVITPLFLVAGTFFPISRAARMGAGARPAEPALPHGRSSCAHAAFGFEVGADLVHWAVLDRVWAGHLAAGDLADDGEARHLMRKDVREFIRRLEAAGLEVESTPGHYHVWRNGKPLRKENGMPVTLPFSPGTTRWRKTAILELRKLGIDV